MIWGNKRKRIRQLETELERIKRDYALEKQCNITLMGEWRKNVTEIFNLRQKLSVPLPFSTPTRLGPIEVLEIQTKKGIDFQLIGLATVMVSLVVAAAMTAVFKKPFKIPSSSELPESPVFHYRYYDWELKEEKILPEREFKLLLNERGLL